MPAQDPSPQWGRGSSLGCTPGDPSLPSPSQSARSQWKAEPYPTIQSFTNINSGLCWMAEGNAGWESENISRDLIANDSPGCSWEHQHPDSPCSPGAAQGPQQQHHPIKWMHGTVWEKHTILVGNRGLEPVERLTPVCLGGWPRPSIKQKGSGERGGVRKAKPPCSSLH